MFGYAAAATCATTQLYIPDRLGQHDSSEQCNGPVSRINKKISHAKKAEAELQNADY